MRRVRAGEAAGTIEFAFPSDDVGASFVSKFYNDRIPASDPGRIRFSAARYRQIEPAASGFVGWYNRTLAGDDWEVRLAEHLQVGDSRAACVVSLEPLLIAAYTDELDCIAMLNFPTWLVTEHALRLQSRLLTVNSYFFESQHATYQPESPRASDLIPGSNDTKNYANFFPVIADFLSDDRQRIANRKSEILDDEWCRCIFLGFDYRERFPKRWRNGSPPWSWIPAK